MKLQEKYKALSFTKQILTETVIFYCLAVLIAFLPFKIYFNEIGGITKTELGFQSFGFLYLLIFGIITTISSLTFNKKIIVFTTIISLIFLVFGLILNTIFFNMYAINGPISPETKFGYFLFLTVVTIYIIRTFKWRNKINNENTNKKLTYIPKIIILSIPLFCAYKINESFNEPIMRGEDYRKINNKMIKSETWDYTEEYDAMVSKYYHFQKTTKINSKHKGKYVLDSISVMIFDDNSNIKKEFSKKAIKGQLDIEEILSEN